MRNFQKIKTIEDYKHLDAPEQVKINVPTPVASYTEKIYYLRMLVRAKYGQWIIPKELEFMKDVILSLYDYDVKRSGIKESWCYVTVRHGLVSSQTDDEWHFDGSSFRTDIIPERNYVWVNNHATEYKVGDMEIPENFNPNLYNLFTFASKQLENNEVKTTSVEEWNLLSPFCLHRRPDIKEDVYRTFYRVCFTDIEGRDINNTQNPLLHTEFYGRNPVETFRNKLINYYN